MRPDGRSRRLANNFRMARKAQAQKVVPRFKPQRRKLFLREWRKYRDNLTQERLADRAGVSQGMISQLENGQSDYTGDLLEKLAYALRCEPADLIMRNPADPEAPWSIWERLKPEHRAIVSRFVASLVEGDEAA
jgi:transcriptional regulator with XRE-family HTH domain